MSRGKWLERLSCRPGTWAGSSWAFALSAGVVLAWAAIGPVFEYPGTWQLVINTGTTIVTFLMVFLIQRYRNNESMAVNPKRNELVAAVRVASNRLISVEDLNEEEVRIILEHRRELVEVAKKDESLTESHSVEDARADHEWKKPARRGRPARSGTSEATHTPHRRGRNAGPRVRTARGRTK